MRDPALDCGHSIHELDAEHVLIVGDMGFQKAIAYRIPVGPGETVVIVKKALLAAVREKGAAILPA